jgi:hypothetical protein
VSSDATACIARRTAVELALGARFLIDVIRPAFAPQYPQESLLLRR